MGLERRNLLVLCLAAAESGGCHALTNAAVLLEILLLLRQRGG